MLFCFILVCDVLPLVINNMDMRLPTSLMQKYMLKAAEFYIGYVTRGPSADAQIQGNCTVEMLSIIWSLTVAHSTCFFIYGLVQYVTLMWFWNFIFPSLSRRTAEIPFCVSWIPALRDWRPFRKVISCVWTLGETIGHLVCCWSTLWVAGRQRTEVLFIH